MADDQEQTSGGRLINFHAPRRVPGKYIVIFKRRIDLVLPDFQTEMVSASILPETLPTTDVATEALGRELARGYGGRLHDVFPADLYGRRGFWADIPDDAIRELATDPRVDYIEPVMKIEGATTQSDAPWHLDRIDQRTLPLNGQYNYLWTGAGVTIWILDSGVAFMHNDFGGRAGSFVVDCTANSGCTPHLTTNVHPGNNPTEADCFGHGTHVASAAAGALHGVAKGARIRAVKMLDGCDNGGITPHEINGLNYVLGHQAIGRNIINLSIWNENSPTIVNLINSAITQGIPVVSSTKNDGTNACNTQPGNLSATTSVVTVSWSNSGDLRDANSAYGPCVTLFAPGARVMTADTGPIPCDSTPIDFPGNNARCEVSGASVAAPQVAGIAALYLEENPSASPATVKSAIVQTATAGVLQGDLGCQTPPSGNCSPNKLAYSLLGSGGSLQFSSPAFSVTENGTSASITVSRTVSSSGAISVNYATSNGSAIAGSDYAAASGTLNWANGDSAPKFFTVSVLDDSVFEGNETINLALSGPTGAAVLGSPTVATLTIADNETPPGTLTLSASSYSVAENGTSVTIAASRAGGSSGAVSVAYSTSNGSATAGSDYATSSGSLSWVSGDTTNKTFSVTILDDTTYEGNESINVSLSAPTGGAVLGSPSAATITILENEASPGTIQLAASGYTVAENVQAVITTVRTGGSSGAVGVAYSTSDGSATAGSDYAASSGTLSWANGDTAPKTFTITVIDDTNVESNETFAVSLSAPTGGAVLASPTSATVTITDNDVPSVPTNLRTNPVGTANGGSYNVLWNASTGFVNHYTLHEVITAGPGTGNAVDYSVSPPATSKSFSKGGVEKDYQYTVRACATASETQCSAWSLSVTIGTCPSGGCTNLTASERARLK